MAAALLSHASQAVLRHFILMKRPRLALEIGTYQGGTAEVMARAPCGRRAGDISR